jgi:hypothetical protein
MQTAKPGQTVTMSFSGIPSGAAVGYQVIKAGSGVVSIGRTELGVIEMPTGSGNYMITFAAPPEGDLYLVVVDWTAGVLAPETTKTDLLQVSTQAQIGDTGLGPVADYVKMRLGGETWKGLTQSAEYGEPFVVQAIELVKRRVMKTPPAAADEGTLDVLVLDYLGILAALELVPAARDYWMNQLVSESTGDDPTEITTYTDRAKLIDDLRDDLVRRLPQAQALAVPLLNDPRLGDATLGPDIDEDDDDRATFDPRDFDDRDLVAPFAGEPIPDGFVRTWRRIG